MRDTVFQIWLIDVSGSMIGDKFELVRQAMVKWQHRATKARLIAFATDLAEIASLDGITPNGGTNLHLALERAAELMAAEVVIFTDGEPSDKDACFAAARKIPGIVHTVFCGRDDDKAKDFCDKLSRDNGGHFVWKDLLKGESLICADVENLLSLPAPPIAL